MKKGRPGSGRSRARRAASQALYQWFMTGEDAAEIEAQFTADRPMENVDLEYFHLLLHNIVKHAEDLDSTLTPNLDRPLAKLDPVEHSILCIGCYELGYRKEVPMRVVINEAIEIAKRFGTGDSSSFINGILDKISATP